MELMKNKIQLYIQCFTNFSLVMINVIFFRIEIRCPRPVHLYLFVNRWTTIRNIIMPRISGNYYSMFSWCPLAHISIYGSSQRCHSHFSYISCRQLEETVFLYYFQVDFVRNFCFIWRWVKPITMYIFKKCVFSILNLAKNNLIKFVVQSLYKVDFFHLGNKVVLMGIFWNFDYFDYDYFDFDNFNF